MQIEEVIRPSAILTEASAARVIRELEMRDVSRGGVWNATPAVWQRFDRPWDGVGGSRGSSRLIGSVAVVYDSPVRHQITIYKVSLSEVGVSMGYTVEQMCDEALVYAGLTLATCPRTQLAAPPMRDPFRSRGADVSYGMAGGVAISAFS
jgi:hypothetical protein